MASEENAERCELILASGSAGRAGILTQAGLHFRKQPADVDERALEREALAENDALDPGQLALLLAEAKAVDVSRANPGALVIGADQVMECGGKFYQKPPTVEAASRQLCELRGRVHSMNAGLCIAQDGASIWQHFERAEMTVRDFSDAFLDAYCEMEGEAMLQSVGAYRIEGPGMQLFSQIDGDYFTIIGLPLLPILGYLRKIGWLAA